MRILIVEARKTPAGYALNQLQSAGHHVVVARTFADADAKLRSFDGGPFDALLTPQYAATGSAEEPNLNQTMEVSPLIELAATVGVWMVGVLVVPGDFVHGQPGGFAWTVEDGRFSVGETRGYVFASERPTYAPKPWDRLLAALQTPAP